MASDNPSLIRQQIGVGVGMAVALSITLLVFITSGPRRISVDRASLCVCCSSLAVGWLLISVSLLARHRFFNADSLDGAGLSQASRAVRVLQALCQNTLEQVVLAICAYGAALYLGPPNAPPLVLDCAGLFCLGRLLFFAAYARGAAARSLGFGLTFYPTIGLFVLVTPRLVATIHAALTGA